MSAPPVAVLLAKVNPTDVMRMREALASAEARVTPDPGLSP